MKLSDLGNRICIIGPSAGGKSTLAKHLGERLLLPVCHLDQLAHIPNTHWQRKDNEAFQKDHDDFLAHHTAWIIEGNYSFLMPQRFAEATFIIWLDFPPLGGMWRYLQRTLLGNESRPGNLVGARSQFSWKQLWHILFTAPKLRKQYQTYITASGKPFWHLRTFQELKAYYRQGNFG